MSYFDKFKAKLGRLLRANAEKSDLAADSNEPAVRGLPSIHVLATGGTIAGLSSGEGARYRAGELKIEALLSAVPTVRSLANVSCEQVANIGSQDLDEALMLKLSARINEILVRKDVDGVIVTHGTDTLEEMAWFLDLTVSSDKPVVLVGAVRPASAVGADGPANLFDAVVVAASPDSVARGVLVAMNGNVFEARDVTKVSTTAVQAFASPNFGPLGQVHDGRVFYWRRSERSAERKTLFDVRGLEGLPLVGIVYGYAGAPTLPVNALVEAGYRGIVSAGVGNGNLYRAVLEALAQAAGKGVAVVRSSRVAAGATLRGLEIEDDKHSFIVSGTLNPQKARVLLQLALTRTQEPDKIQALFDL